MTSVAVKNDGLKTSSAAAENEDIGVFLTACSKLLHENVGVLESAASTVSDLVARSGASDPSLVVALQGFDRLKQEFEALSVALSGYAEHFKGEMVPAERKRYLHDAVERITVAELQTRLLDHISVVLYEPIEPDEAQKAQIEVDVEF